MSISALFRLAKEYLLIGVVLTIFIGILFLIGYFIIYRRLLKGAKKINGKKALIWAIFLIYIIVVLGATLGMRSSNYGRSIELHLFYSYKDAWNSFSPAAWRNIILNIMMFVPMGIMLPLIFKYCKRFWVTYLSGFLFTIVLEVIQLVSSRGIFELDDIFNNTLGCIIGYGLVMIIFMSIAYRKKQYKHKWLTIICLQIPLCITIIAFSTIFVKYSQQELGNLSIAYSYPQDMSKIKISTELKFYNKQNKAYVYNTFVGTKEDTLKTAIEILSAVNSEIDESKNIVYDETIIYYSLDNNYSVWVDFAGLKTSYSWIRAIDDKGKSGLTLDEVKELLSKFPLKIPDKVEFEDNGSGNYTIKVNMYEDGDTLIDGELTCEISSSGDVIGFQNNLICYDRYKEYDIISEQEAYEKIINGEFRYYTIEQNHQIEIGEVYLKYKLDSKGFYQPVYEFVLKDGATQEWIYIPAVK